MVIAQSIVLATAEHSFVSEVTQVRLMGLYKVEQTQTLTTTTSAITVGFVRACVENHTIQQ